MDECEGTYKYSVLFKNFSEYGDFHYPFNDKPAPPNSTFDILEWFLHYRATNGNPEVSFAEWMTPYWRIIAENKVVTDDFQSFVGYQNTGYHLDAIKFANYLRREYCLPRGVQHEIDTIKDCIKDTDGNIASVIGEKDIYLADMFIDCTGFSSSILGGMMGIEWDEFPFLINNKAWAVKVGYTDKSTEMTNHTVCTALDNGWVWQAPLSSRIGTGYNFCDKFISEEDALKEFKEYLGDRPLLSEPRLIKWRNGMAKKIWTKNVVGIGLSAGFIEPLESNGLLSVHNFAVFLCDALSMHDGKYNTLNRAQFNRRCRRHMGQFAHFVGNHFMMTTKDNSKYWRYISEHINYLDDKAENEVGTHGGYPTDDFPLQIDDLAKFNFNNLLGNSYICAGHMHTPTTPWTVDYMDKRHSIDISRFKVLKSGYELDDDINKLIDKFPTPEEFYYEDVSGIDMPHYIHG
jgi:tryptophan halogenase